MKCTVYQVSVCSSPLVVIKAQPKSPWLRDGGHLVIFIVFFLSFWSPVHTRGYPPCRSIVSMRLGSQSLYYLLCFFSFFYLFSSILLLHVREPCGKLYTQNDVASCNGCSHQSNHIEITFSLISFLSMSDNESRRICPLSVCLMHDCMCSFGLFLLRSLLYHIQHVYFVYGVPYMQVAVMEQICSYNI